MSRLKVVAKTFHLTFSKQALFFINLRICNLTRFKYRIKLNSLSFDYDKTANKANLLLSRYILRSLD